MSTATTTTVKWLSCVAWLTLTACGGLNAAGPGPRATLPNGERLPRLESDVGAGYEAYEQSLVGYREVVAQV